MVAQLATVPTDGAGLRQQASFCLNLRSCGARHSASLLAVAGVLSQLNPAPNSAFT